MCFVFSATKVSMCVYRSTLRMLSQLQVTLGSITPSPISVWLSSRPGRRGAEEMMEGRALEGPLRECRLESYLSGQNDRCKYGNECTWGSREAVI